MTPNPVLPIDFSKVEVLRRHLLLSTKDMVAILGVSRMTYYNWVKKGGCPKGAKLVGVKAKLRKLLELVQKGWPSSEILGLPKDEQLRRLLVLMEEKQ